MEKVTTEDGFTLYKPKMYIVAIYINCFDYLTHLSCPIVVLRSSFKYFNLLNDLSASQLVTGNVHMIFSTSVIF